MFKFSKKIKSNSSKSSRGSVKSDRKMAPPASLSKGRKVSGVESKSMRRLKQPRLKKVNVKYNHPLKRFLRVAHGQGDWVSESVEGKVFKRFEPSFDPSDEAYLSALQMASSLVDPGTIYTFRLAHYATLSSDVGGVLATALTCDPSSWSEWSSLSALFTQCRLKRSHLHVMTAFNKAVPTATSNGNWQPCIVNALYDEVAAPTSYDATIDSPNFKVYNHNFDTTKSGIHISLNFTGQREPLWGDVSAPHSSTAFTGTPGCFQIYADGQSVSTVLLSYIMVLDIEFMNRF
jgi:hypothetical protein